MKIRSSLKQHDSILTILSQHSNNIVSLIHHIARSASLHAAQPPCGKQQQNGKIQGEVEDSEWGRDDACKIGWEEEPILSAKQGFKRKSKPHSRLVSSHLGFVISLQDVALHQCLPLSSVCYFPNSGGPSVSVMSSSIFCLVVLLISSLSLVASLESEKIFLDFSLIRNEKII